jgi:hypothetical protein
MEGAVVVFALLLAEALVRFGEEGVVEDVVEDFEGEEVEHGDGSGRGIVGRCGVSHGLLQTSKGSQASRGKGRKEIRSSSVSRSPLRLERLGS